MSAQSASAPFKVTAWSSWADWSETYDRIRSASPDERAKGVQRIHIWRTRARLPVAIETTVSFVEVMINDPVMNPETKAPRNDHELQLMYSMCIVRLVNGIIDVAQRGFYARKMSTLADSLEWPQWFVDIRHEATHGRMPSLTALRLASKEASFLLFERFWRPQKEQLERRGRNRVQSLGQRHNSAPRVRDRQLVDRRLRGLAALAGKKRKASAAGLDTKANENHQFAARAATDLASLAIDETRVLQRIFTSIFSETPSRDDREAISLHMLCSEASENFILRLARDLVTRALGLPAESLQDPAPDNIPSIRNISDTGSLTTDVPYNVGPCDSDAKEADRMLNWLEVMLSVGVEEKADQRQRFAAALKSLAPWMRQFTMRRIVAATSSHTDVKSNSDITPAGRLTNRAARVWKVLGQRRIDSGAGQFLRFCGQGSADFSDKRSNEHAVKLGTKSKATEVSASTAPTGPSDLHHVKAMLQAVRNRNSDVPSTNEGGTETSAAVPPHLDQEKSGEEALAKVVSKLPTVPTEPFTNIGTVMDKNTLAIRCTIGHPSCGRKQAQNDATFNFWERWAGGNPLREQTTGSLYAGGKNGRRDVENLAADVSEPSSAPASPLATVPDGAALSAAEAAFKAGAAALFDGLKPFGSD